MNAKIPGWFVLYVLASMGLTVFATMRFGLSENTTIAIMVGLICAAGPFAFGKQTAASNTTGDSSTTEGTEKMGR